MSSQGLATATIQRLKAAKEKKGELPALSHSLSRILSTMKENDSAGDALVNVVLSDMALTKKVLRLANSAMYSAFGGEVTTVSRALYILGTDAVGHLALGLKLIEGLEKSLSTDQAKQELVKAVMAASMAREMGEAISGRDAEEIALATLLRSLGRALVSYYLPEDFERVAAASHSLDDEDACSIRHLGLTYGELAQFTARSWGLPLELTRQIVERHETEGSHAHWVQSMVNFVRRHVDAVSHAASPAELDALSHRYALSLGVTPSELGLMAKKSFESAHASDYVRKALAIAPKKTTATSHEKDSLEVLSEGVEEVRKIAQTVPLSRLVGVATEVLWRGLECESALLFVRKKSIGAYQLSLGYGPDIAEKLSKLQFEEAFSPNVVHIALSNLKTLYVRDSEDDNIRHRIPSWLKEGHVNAKTLLIVPIGKINKAVGLLCLDWGIRETSVELSTQQLSKVEEVRALMTQAVANSNA